MTTIYQDSNGIVVKAKTEKIEGLENPRIYYELTAGSETARIDFQFGPLHVFGLNGLTNEALLSVLIHRTEQLNKTIPCVENERALTALKTAMAEFDARTLSRMVRSVDGVYVP
jgi:hypothetical protein